MGKVGKIKWFGGYNKSRGCINNYGFITPMDGTEDIYIHKKQIICDIEDIQEEVPVVFEEGMYDGKKCAKKLTLLKDTDDDSIIMTCLENTDYYFYVTDLYIKKIKDSKECEEFLIKLKNKNARAVNEVINKLPEELYKSSYVIRSLMNPIIHLKVLLDMPANDTDYNELITLLEETEQNVQNDTYESFQLESNDLSKIFKLYDRLDEKLYKLLPVEYLHIMIDAFNKDKTDQILISHISKFLHEKANDIEYDEWKAIPVELLENREIYCMAPESYRTKFHIVKKIPIDKEEAIDLLKELEENEQEELIDAFPNMFYKDQETYGMLSNVNQARYYDENLMPWNWLSNKSKVLYLYKLASTKAKLPAAILEQEHLPIINSIACMLLEDSDPRKTTFQQFDELLNKIIITNFNEREKIDLLPILPECADPSIHIPYCEGRTWYTAQEKAKTDYLNFEASRIWCPRKRGVCDKIEVSNVFGGINASDLEYYGRARLYPNTELPWEKWSMVEYMHICNIIPSLPRLTDPHEYLTKVSGWVNRLEELLERAKCSVCHKVMKADPGYAKRFDAVYNATIFNCRNSEAGHDKNIYMNHCWSCRRLIDSRESRIRVEGMYLCIHCGAGPKNSQTYYPGMICPKCGHEPMSENGIYGGIVTCNQCGHTIYIEDK